MYASYLAWFDKIPHFGHVWFLTMIAFAYIGVYTYSRLYNSKLSQRTFGNQRLWLNWFLLVVSVAIMHIGITKMRLPGYMVLYLSLYIIVFRYSGRILSSIGELSLGLLIFFTIAVHTSSIVAYRHGLFENMYLSPVVGILNALTIFAVLFRVFQLCRQSRVITFVSGVSFESYLLHEFFLYNRGVYSLELPPPINYLIFCILSITVGCIMKEVVEIIQRMPKHLSTSKKNL